MTGRFPAICNLRWQELFSPEEIRSWANGQQVPQRVLSEFAKPGVYRFIFPEARDDNSAHTPCYVGEAGKIGQRLLDHFRLERRDTYEERRPRTRELRAGWLVRGSIQNSGGDFKLQVLTIEGPVNFCGLTFGPDSIPDPFENSFVRRMLENWAILASEYVDDLQPLNRRGTPHIFTEILKDARKRSSKKNNTAQRGLQKTSDDPLSPGS